jgi:hypothetical protein
MGKCDKRRIRPHPIGYGTVYLQTTCVLTRLGTVEQLSFLNEQRTKLSMYFYMHLFIGIEGVSTNRLLNPTSDLSSKTSSASKAFTLL